MKVSINTLTDGDRFSIDGKRWHYFAVLLFGTVSVYTTGMRGDDAMCERIPVADDQMVFI